MGLKQSGPSLESQDGLADQAELEEEEEGKERENIHSAGREAVRPPPASVSLQER